MKIAVFTELFYPHIGGQEKRYFELSKRLAKLGHEVHIFTLRHSRKLQAQEIINNVKVERYGEASNYVKDGQLNRSPVGLLKYLATTPIKILLSEHFDVYIFNQWPVLHIPVSIPFCRSKTIIDWCETLNGILPKNFFHFLSFFPDAHTAVADYVGDYLTRTFNVSPKSVRVVPSGVEREKFCNRGKEKKDKGKIVYVGRLYSYKSVDMLIDVVKEAHKKIPQITLDIIGDGPLINYLREYSKGADSFIKIHGELPEIRKIEILKRSWVFATLSRREGFPIAVSEAMAACLPIVTTNNPDNGTRHICKQYGSGVVVQPNKHSVSDAILKLYSDDDLYEYYSRNASNASRFLDWDTSSMCLDEFLKTLVA